MVIFMSKNYCILEKTKKLLAMFIVLIMLLSLSSTFFITKTKATGNIAGFSETDDSLKVHYAFDDGMNIKDSSGNEKDAKIYGTCETGTGVSNGAVLLKGGYIHMPSDILRDGQTNFTDLTVSIWINPLSNTSAMRAWCIGNNEQNFLNLFAPLEGSRYASALRINDNPSRIETANGTFKQNTWSNIVVTYTEANNGTISIYENGVLLQSGSTGGKKVSDLGLVTNALIGRAQFGRDPDFYGYVDDFRIYNRALPQNEIAELSSDGIQSLLEQKAESLDLAAHNGIVNLNGVAQNLNFMTPASINETSAQITWTSDNTNVISNTGVITPVTENTEVNLKATLSRAGKTAEKDFKITVVPTGTVTVDNIVDIHTVIGRAPVLPAKITTNESTRVADVTWDAITSQQYAFAGEFTAAGKITDTEIAVSVKIIVDSTLMENPIIRPGSAGGSPDPFIAFKDGWYYYVRHDFNRGVTVSKAQRLQDIEAAPRVTVYTGPTGTSYPFPGSGPFWAPEIHFIDNNWYIYVTIGDAPNDRPGNLGNHRMWALECTDPTDPQAPYILKGKLAPTRQNNSGEWEIDPAQDRWAIDGTILQSENGKNYFIWSGWPGGDNGEQISYIAEMLNPWTLKGDRTILSRPEQRWELRGYNETDNPKLYIHEGQQILQRDGKVYMFYSANPSYNDWYATGVLIADDNQPDLTDPSVWTKHPGPLLINSLDPTEMVYGPGHGMILPSPNGEEYWFIYHAFQESDRGWIDRSARAQKITFDDEGIPVFGNPIPFGELIKQPSGTPNVIAGKYEAEDATITINGSNTQIMSNFRRASGGKAVRLVGTGVLEFDIDVPIRGEYSLSLQGNSPIRAAFCNKTLTVNGTDMPIRFVGTNGDESDIWLPSHDPSEGKRRGEGIVVNLTKGENKITVKAGTSEDAAADIDYLYLVLLQEDLSPPKISQNPPATPVLSAKTHDSVILTTIENAQYRVNNGAWQATPDFSGLTPNTTYTFQARFSETETHYASNPSEILSVITEKGEQELPAAPTLASRTSTQIVLNTIEGAEYSKDNGTTWQDPTNFAELTPDTEYSFVARMKETTTHNASLASAVFTTKTDAEITGKQEQTPPAAPTLASRTSTQIILIAIPNAQYRRGNGAWQTSPIFTGLNPNTSYTFQAYFPETETHYASNVSAVFTVSTTKATRAKPSAPRLRSKTHNSITLRTVTNAQYRRGNGTWQTSPIFRGLTPNTKYNFQIRIRETTTHNASPVSNTFTTTTNRQRLATPKSLKLTKNRVTWRNVKNNNGYTLRILQRNKVIRTAQIRRNTTRFNVPKNLLKRNGRTYKFTLVAKGKGKFSNSKVAKSNDYIIFY